MKYQKIIKLLENTPNKPSKFRAKNWVKINDDSRGTYNTNSKIKFKTSMLKSSLCDYSDPYIIVKRTITVQNRAVAGAVWGLSNRSKKLIFKNCAPFTDCISERNNT